MFVTLFCTTAIASTPNDAIKLNMDSFGTSCDPILHVSLINTSKKSVFINENALPWSDSFLGASLIIYDWNTSITYKPIYLAMQQSNHNIVVKPSQSLNGIIDLKKRFINFDKEIQSKSQVLYWRYIFFDEEKKIEIVKAGAVSLNGCVHH
jgi:hypothetical protein